MLREQLETQEALDATGKATADLTNYHASIDVERVDYVLVEKLLAFLYSDGEFADAAVRAVNTFSSVTMHACKGVVIINARRYFAFLCL